MTDVATKRAENVAPRHADNVLLKARREAYARS